MNAGNVLYDVDIARTAAPRVIAIADATRSPGVALNATSWLSVPPIPPTTNSPPCWKPSSLPSPPSIPIKLKPAPAPPPPVTPPAPELPQAVGKPLSPPSPSELSSGLITTSFSRSFSIDAVNSSVSFLNCAKMLSPFLRAETSVQLADQRIEVRRKTARELRHPLVGAAAGDELLGGFRARSVLVPINRAAEQFLFEDAEHVGELLLFLVSPSVSSITFKTASSYVFCARPSRR